MLDTHAFLWFVLKDPRLSSAAEAVVADPANDVFVRPASHWELAIKIRLGKYTLGVPFEAFIEQAIHGNDFAVLPIEARHTALVATLPMHHRDPFRPIDHCSVHR